MTTAEADCMNTASAAAGREGTAGEERGRGGERERTTLTACQATVNTGCPAYVVIPAHCINTHNPSTAMAI